MRKHPLRLILTTAALALAALTQAQNDRLYVGLADGSFNGVAQFTPSLGLLDQVAVGGVVNGLSAGPMGTFYAGHGNTIVRYNDDGSVINDISGSGTTVIHDLAFSGSRLYAGLSDQSINGVAQFSSTLGLFDQVSVAGPIAGTAFGPAGTFFIGTGNTIYKYADDGTELGSVSGSGTTVLKDAAFDGTNLYVSLADGAFNGVAIFTENLGFVNQVSVTGPIDALAVGRNGEFYTGVGNTVRWHAMDGTELGTVSGSGTTQILDMSYFAEPVPEPATIGVLALGLAALIRRRRKA